MCRPHGCQKPKILKRKFMIAAEITDERRQGGAEPEWRTAPRAGDDGSARIVGRSRAVDDAAAKKIKENDLALRMTNLERTNGRARPNENNGE
jgi:hypothetical protein